MNKTLPLDNQQIRTLANTTIEKEVAALQQMQDALKDSDIYHVIEALYHCGGRVIISGIGKSAIIAQKIVATFNSTGTPSLYMHAADAIHGDLGMVTAKDIIILISKSGESPEIKALIPLIKKFGNTLIAITGNLKSSLAREAKYVLNTTVDSEADPNNLAPTTSTTAQLVMGDVLAVCLLQLKGFTAQDFAKYHPGGALGKQLYLTVGDVCNKNPRPQVTPNAKFQDIILEITSNRLGATAVVDNNTVEGIITDGDIRRAIQANRSYDEITAHSIMGATPKIIDINELAIKALNIMRNNSISQLIVTDGVTYKGIIHIHDLISEGII